MEHKLRRVAVTGIGAIHALGSDPAVLWDRIINGETGITLLKDLDFSRFPTKLAARVEQFPEGKYLDSKEIRSWDRYIRFGVYAALQAWESAGLKSGAADERTGVWLGTGIGGIETLVKAQTSLTTGVSWRSSPFTIPMMISNMAAGIVSIKVGSRGPCMAPSSACATGNNAIGEAFLAIRDGRVTKALCGGAEAPLSPIAFSGFNSMRAMSTRNHTPLSACTPFAFGRDGFLMGEGAGMLLLEEWDSALERGADILAEVRGYGTTSDAYHYTSPDPEGKGAGLAMSLAMEQAGWKPEEVDYINAHGTGTALGDIAETKAIKLCLGEAAGMVAVSSTKGATGHLFGAAGGIEAVICIKALQTGWVPPTLGLTVADPDCDLDYIPLKARKAEPERILSNGFGFGGHNAVVAFMKVEKGN